MRWRQLLAHCLLRQTHAVRVFFGILSNDLQHHFPAAFQVPKPWRACCRSGFRRRREATVCRTLLQKLKDEQASAVRNQQYPAASCPICFEDLAKPDGASGLPSAASTSKTGQSDSEQGGNGSKFDVVAPSAPPLDAHPELESLLGVSKTQGSSDQETHKHSRCVLAGVFCIHSSACWQRFNSLLLGCGVSCCVHNW